MHDIQNSVSILQTKYMSIKFQKIYTEFDSIYWNKY